MAGPVQELSDRESSLSGFKIFLVTPGKHSHEMDASESLSSLPLNPGFIYVRLFGFHAYQAISSFLPGSSYRPGACTV